MSTARSSALENRALGFGLGLSSGTRSSLLSGLVPRIAFRNSSVSLSLTVLSLRLWCVLNNRYSERVSEANQGSVRRIIECKASPRMKILVSNDDGYLATGINTLTEALDYAARDKTGAPGVS